MHDVKVGTVEVGSELGINEKERDSDESDYWG